MIDATNELIEHAIDNVDLCIMDLADDIERLKYGNYYASYVNEVRGTMRTSINEIIISCHALLNIMEVK